MRTWKSGTVTARRAAAATGFLCAFVLIGTPASGQLTDSDLRLGSRVLLLANEPDLMCVGGGIFDPIKEGYSRGTAGYSGVGLVEYRHGRKFLFAGPLMGILANSDGGVFGYGGFFFDFALGPLRFEPMLSFGGYRRGDSKDLGGVLEIHTGANFAYRFEQGSRIGVEMNHISNGNMHDRNPGVELILVTVMLPLGQFDTGRADRSVRPVGAGSPGCLPASNGRESESGAVGILAVHLLSMVLATMSDRLLACVGEIVLVIPHALADRSVATLGVRTKLLDVRTASAAASSLACAAHGRRKQSREDGDHCHR